MKDGEVVHYGPGIGGKFKALVDQESSSFNIRLGIVSGKGWAIVQDAGGPFVALPSPAMMRGLGQILCDLADKWERGETPELPVPPTDVGRDLTKDIV